MHGYVNTSRTRSNAVAHQINAAISPVDQLRWRQQQPWVFYYVGDYEPDAIAYCRHEQIVVRRSCDPVPAGAKFSASSGQGLADKFKNRTRKTGPNVYRWNADVVMLNVA